MIPAHRDRTAAVRADRRRLGEVAARDAATRAAAGGHAGRNRPARSLIDNVQNRIPQL